MDNELILYAFSSVQSTSTNSVQTLYFRRRII